MGKKRRQHVSSPVDVSEESTESEEGYIKGKKCSHINNAVNLNKLRKIVKKNKMNNKCIECQNNKVTDTETKDENADESYNLWICLQCGHIACGREEKSHAKKHYKTPTSDLHCIVINICNWSLWCYKCDDTVSNRNGNYKEILDLLKEWIKCAPKKSPLCCNEILYMNTKEKKINSDVPIVGGLVNLGNTCFFNAVLQCLAQTPYLIKVLDDLQVPGQKFELAGGKFKESDNVEIDLPPIEGVLEKSFNFTPVLRKTLTEMQKSGGQNYKPSELFNSLKKKTAQCTDGGQHDSHELLRHLLEFVRNEDLMRYHAVILQALGLSDKEKRQCIDQKLKSRVKYYGCQASAKLLGPERVFRGELESTLECLVCHHSSSRTEPFLDLSLPVLIDKAVPPVLRRKSGILMDSDLNEIHKSNKKNRITKQTKKKKNNQENMILTSSNADNTVSQKKENLTESEESDADIEDNIENEDSSVLEIGECDYSSEKPSTAPSPILLGELHTAVENMDPVDLNISLVKDDLIYDTTGEKMKVGMGLSLATPSTVHSDFTVFSEGPTISPLSSPLTSKDSPTSQISSTVDVDEIEKTSKIFFKLDNADKLKSNKIEDTLKKKNINLADKKKSIENESSINNKLTNGISDLTSSIKKLKLSSTFESPRYETKEGECSIQLCLNQFTALELMRGNNKVSCEACTEREKKGKIEGVKMVCTESTKQYLISRVPAVLILHLKRFQVQKFSFRKVGKHVSFPMLLDLAPVSKDYTKPRIYALYGVVEHSGTLYGGHYVAYVKSRPPLKPNDPRWSFLPSKDSFENEGTSGELNSDLDSDGASIKTPTIQSPPGRWYFISDARVNEVDENTVLKSEAYLLFYERIL